MQAVYTFAIVPSASLGSKPVCWIWIFLLIINSVLSFLPAIFPIPTKQLELPTRLLVLGFVILVCGRTLVLLLRQTLSSHQLGSPIMVMVGFAATVLVELSGAVAVFIYYALAQEKAGIDLLLVIKPIRCACFY